MKARVAIYDAANSTELAPLWDVDSDGWQRNFDDLPSIGRKLNESGSASLVLQVDHPAADHVTPGNVLRLYGDTHLLWSGRITHVEEVLTSRTHRQKTLSVDVEDLLEDWRAATVDPWNPDTRPISADRVWNWASPPLDRSSWLTKLEAQTRTVTPLRPLAWPAPPEYSGWVWTRAYSPSQPVGDVGVVRPYTLGADADVVHYFSCDDEFELLIDGTFVDRHVVKYPDTSGWEKTYRFVVPHTAGDHLFAARCRNHGGAAAFLHIAFTVANGVIDTPLFASGPLPDGGWLALDYPTTWPGFTGPEIVQMLLTEAQARGALTGWTVEVHGTHSEIEEFSVRVDQTLRAVLDGLIEWMDIVPDDENLKLHLYPAGELGSTPGVTVGVKSLSRVDSIDVITAAKGVWSDGVRWRTRSPHPVVGRREGALQLGAVKDESSVDAILDRYLDVHAVDVPEVVAEVVDGDGKTAGVDFAVGDTVTVPGYGEARTVGLSWKVERNGDLTPTVEFDAVSAGRRRELSRVLDRQIAAHDDPLTANLLSSEPLVVSGRPGTSEQSWSWAEDIEDVLDPDDPDRGWQPFQPETVQRVYAFGAEIKQEDLPDAFDVTRFQLLKNGSLWHSLFQIDLTTTVWQVQIPIYGYYTVRPGDQLSVRVVDSYWGGHVDGRVWIGLADAV